MKSSARSRFPWLRPGTLTKFLSSVVLEIFFFSMEHRKNFLNFSQRRFSQAWNEVIELKIRVRAQLIPKIKRWNLFGMDAKEKNESGWEKDDVLRKNPLHMFLAL